jgi:hypothetical protein
MSDRISKYLGGRNPDDVLRAITKRAETETDPDMLLILALAGARVTELKAKDDRGAMRDAFTLTHDVHKRGL